MPVKQEQNRASRQLQDAWQFFQQATQHYESITSAVQNMDPPSQDPDHNEIISHVSRVMLKVQKKKYCVI